MRGFVREAGAVVHADNVQLDSPCSYRAYTPFVLQARPSGRQPRMLLEAEQPQPGSDPVQRTQIPGK